MRKITIILFLFWTKVSFCQLNDNFEDGDFSSNPTWFGDTEFFTINSAKQLQTLKSTVSQAVFLATKNAYSLNAKWDFYVKLNFDPTATNFVRIYLTSNQKDLKGPLNGYFVEIGESGAADGYHLYRQTGSRSTKIISGPAKIRGNSNLLTARIRVTRDNQGKWDLYVDNNGGNNYTLEGTITDNSHTESEYFGVYCKYATVSRSGEYFFTDFSVTELVPDLTPPDLVKLVAVDSLHYDAVFSKDLDTTALNPLNYNLSGGNNQVIAVVQGPKPNIFRLRFAEALATNHYTLTVNNVKDKKGNLIGDSNTTSIFIVKARRAKKGDVVINEIFANPPNSPALPPKEFVELWNTTSEYLLLKGWKYSDLVSSYSFGNDTLRPGQHIILCARADTGLFKPYGQVIGLSPWPTLNNDKDVLTLRNEQGEPIDQVAYSDSWYGDETKKKGGFSLELIDPENRCAGSQNWIASTDVSGGSPGRQNSVYQFQLNQETLKLLSAEVLDSLRIRLTFNKPVDSASASVLSNYRIDNETGNPVSVELSSPDFSSLLLQFPVVLRTNTHLRLIVRGLKDCAGNEIDPNHSGANLFIVKARRAKKGDVVINEIFANPPNSPALPPKEFVELWNTTSEYLLLKGWKYSDLVSNYSFGNDTLRPGQHIILCARADTGLFKPYGQVIGLSPWPTLNNDKDVLTLRNEQGELIDQVAYSDSWYGDETKKKGGFSLELIDPENRCTGSQNWLASMDATGGSPGRQNSIYRLQFNQEALKLSNAEVLDSLRIRLTFNKPVDSASASALSNYLIDHEMGSPALVELNTTDFSSLLLQFPVALRTNTHLRLIVRGLKDCAGNEIDPNHSGANLFIVKARRAKKGDVVINEIFANPPNSPALPPKEFVELWNTTSEYLLLKGWKYSDLVSNYSFGNDTLRPGQHIILCARADTGLFKPYGQVIGLSPWPTLNNDKDVLTLRNEQGELIDQVAYSDSWYRDETKKRGGFSLELIDPENRCTGSQNWLASMDTTGGSPGRQNSVYRLQLNKDPLKLISTYILDSVSLQVTFSKSVDSVSATNIQNYGINNGIGKPYEVTIESPGSNRVVVKLLKPLVRGVNNVLTVSNINDCAGNDLEPGSGTAILFMAKKITENDILISEILFNPKAGGSDFVEIYNNTSQVLDLKELQLANRNTSGQIANVKTISSANLFIPPASYWVLSTNPSFIKENYFVENRDNFIKMDAFPAYNNDKGSVILMSDSLIVDQLDYQDKMHLPLLRDVKGVSLERGSFLKSANEAGNFRSAAAASGYATPSYKNSQHVENATAKNEINLQSTTFSPDGDGYEDVLQTDYQLTANASLMTVNVFTDKGTLVRKLLKNQSVPTKGSFIWDGLHDNGQICTTGIYILVIDIFDLNGHTKRYLKTCVLATKLY